MDSGDSQVPGQMVVVDISDQVFAIVVQFEGSSEEADCMRQILLQNAEIEIGVPLVFAIVPEVRRPKKPIECGIVAIPPNRAFQLGLYLRNRAVLVPMIDAPESLDSRSARAPISLVLVIIVCRAICEAGQREQGNA